MNLLGKLSATFILMVVSLASTAGTDYVTGMTIQQIRAVGNYNVGTTYDNTIELWFTSPIVWNKTLSVLIQNAFI